MASTYTLNNGIELIGTGEQSGTWGDTTNTNFELVDTALDGQVSVTLASAGSSGSPNNLPVSDGATSNGRNRMITFVDGGDLGATAFVQLTPNDSEKIIYVRNDLSGSRSVIMFQGTYNASNDYEIPAGTTAIIYFDGAGSGAVAANVFNNAYFDSLRLGGVSVTAIIDDDSMGTASATNIATSESIKAYVDAQVGTADELSEVLANGNTTGGTDLAVSTGDNITFVDNSKAIFGTGGASSKLEIYSSGTNSHVKDNGAGSLLLQGDSLYLSNAAGSLTYFYGASSTGAAQLRYNNSPKLATSATGIDVTGTVTADGLTVEAGTTSKITVSENTGLGTASIDFVATSSFPKTKIVTDIAAGDLYLETLGNDRLKIANNGDISFYEDTGFTPKMVWNSSAENLYLANTNPVLAGVSTGVVSATSFTVGGQTSGADSMYIRRAAAADYQLQTTNAGGSSGEIHLQPYGGNVGIGTSSPTSILHVKGRTLAVDGAAASDSPRLNLDLDGTNKASVLLNRVTEDLQLTVVGSNDMTFTTNASEAMRIDSSGNVGIGCVPSPIQSGFDTLQIGGNLTLNVDSTGAGAGVYMGNNVYRDSTNSRWEYINTDEASQYLQANGTHIWRTAASGSANAAISWSEAMRIDASGNVGIGTSSPGNIIEAVVADNEVYDGTTNLGSDSSLRILNDSSTTGSYSALKLDSKNASGSVGQWRISSISTATNYDNDLAFTTRTGSSTYAERMRIDASGNLLVGNTSTGLTSDGINLHGNGTLEVRRNLSTAGSSTVAYLSRGTSEGNILQFYKDTTHVGSIGTKSGGMFIGSDDAGIFFNDHGGGSSDALFPYDVGTNTFYNGHVDIGGASNKFRNIHISGSLSTGDGVTFGDAGGSGTSTSNTLDDYEEGTWTPVFSDASTAGNVGTPATVRGIYTKVGNMVTVWCTAFDIDTTGMTGANDLYIQGLPFTPPSYTGPSHQFPGTARAAFVTFTGSLVAGAVDNNTYVRLNEVATGVAIDSVIVSQLTSGTADIAFTLTYQTT